MIDWDRMGQRSAEQGFTLIEVMITVAIIALLAAIAVPAFTSESRKSKGGSEVGAVMGELAVREEQYRLENNAYLAAAACPAIATISAQAQDASGCIAAGQPWNTLRVGLPQTTLYCSYQVVAGTGTGTAAPAGFTFASPANSWFYILATCDLDGDATVNSTYFMSSLDSTIQKQNVGH